MNIDLTWKEGKLTKGVLRSLLGNPVQLLCGKKTCFISTKKGEKIQLLNYLK